MSNLFDRPTFDVTLPDGRACRIHRVGGSEYAEALRAADQVPQDGDRVAVITASNIAYWSTLCRYGLADPVPESAEQVAALLSKADLQFVADRILFRSDLADDPDKAVDEPAWDAEVPVSEEAEVDPLVDEFPAPEYAAVAAVADDAAAVRDVPLPAESVGAGVGGSAPVHGGAGDRAAEAPRVADS